MIGDALFCVWPLKGGCGGAAAATALATLVSSTWMVKALQRSELWPQSLAPMGRMPKKQELSALMEFTGPLLAITLTRMAGFMNMQRRAMALGLESLAGFQLCMNFLVFFILFGEPLSQLGQTTLPSLIDSNNEEDGMRARETFRSILVLSMLAAVGVGGAAFLTALMGPGLFSSNVGVQAVARAAAPTLFFAVATAIVGIAVDGAMMASRDFGFMLSTGVASFLLQAKLLEHCNSIGGIFVTFAIRLGVYAFIGIGRAALGYGNLGRAIQVRKRLSIGLETV